MLGKKINRPMLAVKMTKMLKKKNEPAKINFVSSLALVCASSSFNATLMTKPRHQILKNVFSGLI
jgi:hypothetical protein